MSEYSIVLGISIFLGVLFFIGTLGVNTGMSFSRESLDVNRTYNQSGVFDNINYFYDYMTGINSEYPAVKYIVVVPIVFVGLYFLIKLLVEAIPL